MSFPTDNDAVCQTAENCPIYHTLSNVRYIIYDTCDNFTCDGQPVPVKFYQKVNSVMRISYDAVNGCGGNGVAHYLCRASRYCANQGYVAGFETEWGVPAVVSCVKGKKLLVSYATLENQGCGGDVDGLPHLSCRASRYCASKGYISGFQTEWGTSAAVVCVK